MGLPLLVVLFMPGFVETHHLVEKLLREDGHDAINLFLKQNLIMYA
jgi:hypothetical protein